MAYTYDVLKGKTVAELRKIASGVQDEAVQGYTQLNKDHLLVALCRALKIDTHAHQVAHGTEKLDLKAAIRAQRRARDAAMESGDPKTRRKAQIEIHGMKRELRKLAAEKPLKKSM